MYSKEIFERVSTHYGIFLEEWNHDIDHIHIMFRASPDSSLAKFIGVFKSASSRLIKRNFPVRQMLWKEMFWSRSFCLLSTGGAPIVVIRKYIESQGNGKTKNKKK